MCRFKAKSRSMQASPSVALPTPLSCPALITSGMAGRTPSPVRSPRTYIWTVSPLCLPPSPVSATTPASSTPSATAPAEVSAASSGTSYPLIPVSSATGWSSD